MNDTPAHPSSTDFAQHWMAWLALRHFLPARLLRELISVVVQDATKGQLSLQDLFEEVSGGTELWNECWLVRQRYGAKNVDYDPKREYYVRLVRGLVLGHDDGGWAHMVDQNTAAGELSLRLLDTIVSFGAVDFGSSMTFLDRHFEPAKGLLQESFKRLVDVFNIAQRDHRTLPSDEFWGLLRSSIDLVNMPLRAVMTKHVADCCADADAWDKALRGYDRVGELLAEWKPQTGWEDVCAAWRTSVISSREAAFAITQDEPKTAAEVLEHALSVTHLAQDPLRVANLSFDALVASLHPRAERQEHKDPRVSITLSPLLVGSQDRYTAINCWLGGRYSDAQPRFWGLLRRQLALGAAADSRTTKVWYARCILDELSDILEKDVRPEGFQRAVGMLVESGDAGATLCIQWREPLLATYVNEACIKRIIYHARAYQGARIARELVVIALFKEWVPRLVPSRREIVLLMWRHIAALAKEFSATLERSVDVGRSSLKALQELAKKRGDIRSSVSQEVQEAICKTMRDEFWGGAYEACDTARAYAGAFDETSMSLVINAVLDRLRDDSTNDLINRSALAFLVSTPVKEHAVAHPETGKTILKQILDISLEQESEHRLLPYYLHDFDPSLLQRADVRTRLKEKGVIENLRDQVKRFRTINVTGEIKALLLAPYIAGHDGIRDALQALRGILDSVKKGLSPGLAFAYDPLMSLLELRPKIEQALPDDKDWLAGQLRALLDRIPGVWQQAARHPVILAPFAFPRSTRSNPVSVHNWAFASLQFAEELGHAELVEAALRGASENPELRPHIALARATRSVVRPIDAADLQDACTNDPEAFYAAIGRRLAQLKTTSGDPADLCKVLVEQCLRFGPRDIDAAVFMEAARLGLHDHVRTSGMSDYQKRLEGNPDRRLILTPILLEIFAAKPSLLPSDLAAQWADGRLLLEVPR